MHKQTAPRRIYTTEQKGRREKGEENDDKAAGKGWVRAHLISRSPLADPEPLLLRCGFSTRFAFLIVELRFENRKMMDADSKWEVISLLVHDHISLKAFSPPLLLCFINM